MHPKALFTATGLALTSALALGACGRQTAFPAGQAQAGPETPDLGYRKPPELRGVSKAADGTVSLSGVALPSSQVRMVSPAGARIETTADGSGAWTARMGPVSEPTLYRLAEEAGTQRVEAEGLIAVLPGAPAVALLRSGSGAQVQDPSKGGLRILAVDYDSGGGTVVSGRARAGVSVRVMVDGQPAIEGPADAEGRFTLSLPKPLAAGQHKLHASTAQASADAEIPVSTPAPPKDGPYLAQAQPYGWRIDWMTAGGGLQTTLLLGG